MFRPKGPVCQSCSMPLSRDEKGGGTSVTDKKVLSIAATVIVMVFLLSRHYAFTNERTCALKIARHVYSRISL